MNKEFLIDNLIVDDKGYESAIKAEHLDIMLIKMFEFDATDIFFNANEKVIINRYDKKLNITNRNISKSAVEDIAKKIFGDDVIARASNGDYCDQSYRIRKKDIIYIFRCNATKSRVDFQDSVQITMRAIEYVIKPLEKVGLSKEHDIYKNLFHKEGIGFICGATGSGKSSTMSSCVGAKLSEENANLIINSYDKPIEFVYDSVEKPSSRIYMTELKSDQKFSEAIINSYRRKPDIIIIGELREYDALMAAIQASRTGHYVLGTIHVDNVSSAFRRILLTFPPDEREAISYDLVSQTKIIIAQRLLSKKTGGMVAVREFFLINSKKRKILEAALKSKFDISSVVRKLMVNEKTDFKNNAKLLLDSEQITKEVYNSFIETLDEEDKEE